MRLRHLALAAAAVLAGGTTTVATAAPSATGVEHRADRVCAAAHDGVSAACSAWIRTDGAPQPHATGTPAGYGPGSLQSAYNLVAAAASNGAGKVIAIVDAYHDPSAIKDVNVYRNQYGLAPLTTCTAATVQTSQTPCIAQVNQTGGTSYPRTDGGWAQEISLDLDMASAICPKCNLLLVEASSNSFANLGAAVNYAAAHAFVVSNSYGGSDTSDATYGKYYNHPGVAITVSSGDAGYGAEYPASSQYVTAVGGTSLRSGGTSSRGWTETAWSGAGSGCSRYNAKPSWQHDLGCANRTVADVSAVADPQTGVAVYDSTKYQGRAGWMVFGGTSASAPIIAAVYALAGNTAGDPASRPYASPGSLYDVAGGSNGSCGGTYLCTAVSGYDGPTGLGTPNGIGAF